MTDTDTDTGPMLSIREERTRMLAQQIRQGSRSALIVSTLLGLMFVPVVGWMPFLIWYALMMLSFSTRDIYIKRLMTRPSLTDIDERRIGIVICLQAFIINWPSVAFFPAMSMELRSLYATISIAWVGAAAFIIGLQPRSYTAYVTISMGMMAIGWWQSLQTSWAAGVTFMLAACGALFVRYAQLLTHLFTESIEIRHTNQRLVNQLTASLAETALAQKTRSRFLAAASHDLLQPVHALLLLVGVLRDSQAEATRQQASWRIEQTAYAIESMFRGLLDQARLDAGAITPKFDTVTLLTVFRSIDAAYQPRCQEKNIRLIMDCPEHLRVRADPALLDRALRNIVDNAVKFTHEGHVAIRAWQEGHHVHVKLEDTGPGIETTEQVKVFDAFYRGESATHTGVEGVGLGLAVTQQLLQLMGTTIQLHSASGQGTCITLTFSSMRAEPLSDTHTTAGSRSDPFPYRHFVMIEDDRAAREAMSLWLTHQGCDYVAAGSLAEALALCHAQSFHPDCILSDFKLTPGPDGLMAIEALRSEFGPLPAVLITGEHFEDDQIPHDVHLMRKPVKPQQLQTLLHHMGRP